MIRPSVWLVLACCALPPGLRAQAISPGKLSEAHAGLEGIRGCTSCHLLRTPGASPERCLQCHEPLRARIGQGKGYHGRLTERNCGECHKEHFGREAALVRLDRSAFDHRETGYALQGAHARAACDACHRRELVMAADVRAAAGKSVGLGRTFLGLPTSCAACHAEQDPHGGQFKGRECSACHVPADWKPAARFDHATARYRLTGMHQDVACDKCHSPLPAAAGAPLRYRGLAFATCRSCHQDPHRGAMGGDCAQCHTTAGWGRVPATAVATRFQHASTRFPLRGAHAAAECTACHGRASPPGLRVRFVAGSESRTFPRPVAGSCGACHLDTHGGAFAGTACDACHGEGAWRPASYDVARHATATFPLTGAHAAVPCGGCHPASQQGAARFRLAERSCRACHAAQDPHSGAFGAEACDRCHDTGSFEIERWDHARSAEIACRTCHAGDDPHGAQFAGRSCGECHGTERFKVAAFDHRSTRFPLDGKHADVACAACHGVVQAPGDSLPRVRYRPLPVRCQDCHGGTA